MRRDADVSAHRLTKLDYMLPNFRQLALLLFYDDAWQACVYFIWADAYFD